MKRPTRRALEFDCMLLRVENWNLKHRPGADVIVTKDDGSEVRSKTRSEAHLLGGHTACVMVEGISGFYPLSRVRPL